MRQVQVRGCLPAIALLLVLGGLVALVISASLAVAIPVAAALLLIGLARSLWYRLTGRSPPPMAGATFRTIRIDLGGPVGPGGPGGPGDPAGDQGPIVDALPRPRPPTGLDGPTS
jgi:hypothetical protein